MPVRDSALLDALEAIPPVRFSGTVWRVVREDRDPCQCSAPGGRWDDGTFDVLYTALTADGAMAEMFFHLSRGQPVIPSQVRYRLHELAITLDLALKLPDIPSLERLGLPVKAYGQLSYVERTVEYPRSQEIGEAAHFLDFDGLLVPGARWDCLNAVVFCQKVPPEAFDAVHDHGEIDWRAWQASHYG